MNIITLDIDDCIWPSPHTHLGTVDDSHVILECNMRRIKMMIEKYDMEVFITSSWHSILEVEDKKLIYANESYYKTDKPYYQYEKSAFDIIEKYTRGYICGKSKGNRYDDVRELLEEGHKIINLDDMNFDEIQHENHLWIEMHGFLDNGKTWLIKQFMGS